LIFCTGGGNNSFGYPTGKIDNSYTQALTEASFKLEGKIFIIKEFFSNRKFF